MLKIMLVSLFVSMISLNAHAAYHATQYPSKKWPRVCERFERIRDDAVKDAITRCEKVEKRKCAVYDDAPHLANFNPMVYNDEYIKLLKLAPGQRQIDLEVAFYTFDSETAKFYSQCRGLKQKLEAALKPKADAAKPSDGVEQVPETAH
ncbi:MAG: hypothetical protein V4736_15090 [Bdellovibrionota bacterium]